MLHQIQREIHRRAEAIEAAHGPWPCRKGCDDCCRNLASEPRVSGEEWLRISTAIDALPAQTAHAVRERIRGPSRRSRPVVCPLLDCDSGTCLIYDARPLICRSYGFYAQRESVLGCHRIELLSRQSPEIIWGNHGALEDRLLELGPAAELSAWLGDEGGSGT